MSAKRRPLSEPDELQRTENGRTHIQNQPMLVQGTKLRRPHASPLGAGTALAVYLSRFDKEARDHALQERRTPEAVRLPAGLVGEM
jgi:hypothetical protein